MSGALWAVLAAVALLLVVAAVAAVWAAAVRGRRRRAGGGASPARLALKKKAAAAAAAAAAADNSDKDDRNPDVVPSLSGDWSEPEAASSPRGTPVAPDPEPPPSLSQAVGGLTEKPPPQVFSVCSATAGPYVPHPATLRRPSRTCRRQADGQGQPEVTYAELRLPIPEVAPLTLPRPRHEPVIYAQIDHAPASTSSLSSRSPPVARSLQRTVSPPHSLPLLGNIQTEVVTVRTPLMSGQQESCV